jgi:hypothetical protein
VKKQGLFVITIGILTIIMTGVVYAQSLTSSIHQTLVEQDYKTTPQDSSEMFEKPFETSFLGWVNSLAIAATEDTSDSREVLRNKWEQTIGTDIFMPYFQAKKMEEWIKEKAKVAVFNMKGKPEFNRNQVQYIFHKNF